MIVKQGGQQVTIVDPKTKDRIELKAGRYELQLAGGGADLQLSTDTFTLERGDKTVVTVRRESKEKAPLPEPSVISQGEHRPADAISSRTRAIRAALDEHVPMVFAKEPSLADVLTFIKQATFKGKKPTDPGLPIYVDPVVERALTSKVRMNVNGAPLKVTLSLLLGQLGLAYLVKDDVLIISSPGGVDRERDEIASPAADASPGTKRVLAKLEEPISMAFANRTSLDDVLTYIRQATTTSRGHDGIPIVTDPRGFQEAGCSFTSTVSMDLDGVPLKMTLKLILEQLGLADTVKDGTVIISSTEGIWRWKPRTGAEQPPITEVARFLGHDEAVEIAVVSPDGRRILSGSVDKTLILWDRETAQPIRRLRGHTAAVRAVAISPDGRRAVSGGEDKVVRLWDLETGETIREFRGHTEWVFSVAFSPDGRLAYSTSGGFHDQGWRHGTDSAIRVWDVATGQEVRKLEAHKGIVWSVAISPDGRSVLSGGHEMTPILQDAKTGAEVRRFPGHTGDITCVAFLPDGRRAVSCSADRTIRLWDVNTGQEIHEFRGHSDAVVWVAVSPDGCRLLSSSYNGSELCLWDVVSRKMIHRIDWGTVNPTRGSFTPDGRHAVWGGTDGVIRMYRLPAPNLGKADRSAAVPGKTP